MRICFRLRTHTVRKGRPNTYEARRLVYRYKFRGFSLFTLQDHRCYMYTRRYERHGTETRLDTCPRCRSEATVGTIHRWKEAERDQTRVDTRDIETIRDSIHVRDTETKIHKWRKAERDQRASRKCPSPRHCSYPCRHPHRRRRPHARRSQPGPRRSQPGPRRLQPGPRRLQLGLQR